MNDNAFRKVAALVLVLGVTLSAVGGFLVGPAAAAIASPSIDSETTTTSTTSDLTDSTTVSNIGNDSVITLEAEFGSQNPEIRMIDPASGEVIHTWVASDDAVTQTGTDGSGNTHYAADIPRDAGGFGDVPADFGEQKQVEFELVNDNTADTESTTTIDVTMQNGDARAVDRVGADNVETQYRLSELVGLFDRNVADAEETVTFDETVNGQEVYVDLVDAEAADAFAAAAEDDESGERMADAYVLVDNGDDEAALEPVYNGAPSETPDGAYAVYDSTADEVRFVDNGEYDGQVDIQTVGNGIPDLMDAYDAFGGDGLFDVLSEQVGI